jgi:rhodanese-related sulfurtransferase
MSGAPGPNVPSPSAPLDQRGLPAGYPFKPHWETTPRETRAALSDPASKPILLDCRRPEEWQAGHINGATHIPMSEIERRLDELETDDGERGTPIIVHCHHGARSLKVTAALRAHGFTNVQSMAGGIDLWSIDIDPGIPRY